MAYGDSKSEKSKKPKPPPKKKPKSKSEGDDPFDNIKEGALKKQLGFKEDDKIPKTLLERIKKSKAGTNMKINGKNQKITDLLQKRVNFALNFGYKKKK
tara:strand:+ start:738 stop:1034 length:297 start_codon:yes stop_codon:yes gene_type:complete